MFTHPFPSGSEREKRLCFITSPDGQDRALPPFQWLNDQLMGGMQGVNEQLNPQIPSERNMMDDVQWINAFVGPDGSGSIFDVPEKPAVPAAPMTPAKALESLSPAARVAEWEKFKAKFLSPEASSIAPELGLSTTPDEAKRQVQYASDIFAMVLGQVSGEALNNMDATKRQVAELALRARYAPGKPGILHQDVKSARARSDKGKQGLDYTNPELFAKSIDGSSFAKGAALLGIVDQETLKGLQSLRGDMDVSGNLEVLRARQERNPLNRSIREGVEQSNRTFMENWDTLSGKQKFAIAAIGIYVGYKMFNSNWKVLKAIPVGLVGWYAYLRLVKGDTEAMNTIGTTIKSIGDMAEAKVTKFGRWTGHFGSQEDVDYLNVMANFLGKNYEKIRPSANAFAALSQVRLSTIATAFTLSDDGRGGYLELDPKKSNLLTELKAVARKEGYNEKELIDYFRTHNGEISSGIAHVFYLHGASLPGNRETAEHIDNARQSTSKVISVGGRVGVNPEASFDDIPDTAIDPESGKTYRHLYWTLCVAGMKNSGEGSFVDLIRKLSDVSSPEKKKDKDRENAQRLNNPLNARVLGFFASVRDGTDVNTLKPKEDILKKNGVLSAEFNATIDDYERIRLIDADAKATFSQRMETIMEDKTKKLSEIFIAIERLKYAILINATKKKLPLDKNDALNMTGGPGEQTASAVYQFLMGPIKRNVFAATSDFDEIKHIEDVEALIKERLLKDIKSINGVGFPVLNKKLESYRILFKALKEKDVLNPTLVTMLGGEPKGRELLNNLLALNTKERVEAMERYFSQRMTNSLALAMLTIHQSSGEHRLHQEADQRSVTPIEEQNLADEFDVLFKEIVGDVTGGSGITTVHAKEGMWEMVDVRDANIGFDSIVKIDLKAAVKVDEFPDLREKDEPLYADGLSKLSTLGHAWLLLKNRERAGTISSTERDQLQDLERRAENIAEKLKEHIDKVLDAKKIELASDTKGHALVDLMLRLLTAMKKENTDAWKKIDNYLNVHKTGAAKPPPGTENPTPAKPGEGGGTAKVTPIPEGQKGVENDKTIESYAQIPGLKVERDPIMKKVTISRNNDYQLTIPMDEYDSLSVDKILDRWIRHALETLKQRMNEIVRDPYRPISGMPITPTGWSVELKDGNIVEYILEPRDLNIGFSKLARTPFITLLDAGARNIVEMYVRISARLRADAADPFNPPAL
ncbi:MAG: hypothetical protein Q7R81_05465 [Candidatus Peregrinibacteria bacterium]|nr:hypothetical protein [Candidatus Peregrinibacteria bacterium]